MKKKSIETTADTGDGAALKTGEGGAGATCRQEAGRADGLRDLPRDRPWREERDPNDEPASSPPPTPDGAEKDRDGGAAAPLPGDAADTAVRDDAVFRDIINKAVQGNIKYQELYLKYIDLISNKMIDENEVVYEAMFIDDQDQEA